VLTEILTPDDSTGAAIHDEVRPFVDKLDAVKRSLWKKGKKREYPD
jgi:hypothetical protein